MDIGKDLANAYEEGMRDARAKIDNEVFELQTEVKRLERICHSYALQYGTVKDQQKVIDKAKAEVAMEIFEEFGIILDSMIQLNHGICINHADYLEQEKAIAAEEALRAFRDYVAELKKKYQEGEPNG